MTRIQKSASSSWEAEHILKQPNNQKQAAPHTPLKTTLTVERGLLLSTHKPQIRKRVPANSGGVECPVARLLRTAPMDVATTMMARTMAYPSPLFSTTPMFISRYRTIV